MGPERQREPDFCPEVIGERYRQSNARNAPIKRKSVTSLCLWTRTKPCQLKRRGQVFHSSNSLPLTGEEVGAILQSIIFIPYIFFILISHKEKWLSRGGTKTRLFMLQLGDGCDELNVVTANRVTPEGCAKAFQPSLRPRAHNWFPSSCAENASKLSEFGHHARQ